MQEDLHDLLVNLYLGSLGHLHIRAQKAKDRRLVLDRHLDLPGLPLRSCNICPVRCWPLESAIVCP